MTEPIQWGALSPRERDALVAEKVMGWNPDAPCTGTWVALDPEPDGLYCTGCGEEIGWGDLKESRKHHGKAAPLPYSTSLDIAWRVADDPRFGMVEVKKWPRSDRFDDTPYSCIVIAHMKHHDAWGTTPAEAICIAALKACGVEVAP